MKTRRSRITPSPKFSFNDNVAAGTPEGPVAPLAAPAGLAFNGATTMSNLGVYETVYTYNWGQVSSVHGPCSYDLEFISKDFVDIEGASQAIGQAILVRAISCYG